MATINGITINGILSLAILKVLTHPGIRSISTKRDVYFIPRPSELAQENRKRSLVTQILSFLILQHHRIHLIFERQLFLLKRNLLQLFFITRIA